MKAWFLRCWLAVLRVCEGSTHPQQAGHSCIMSGSAVPSSKPASSTFTNSVDIMYRGGVGDQVGAPLVWLADSGAVLQESLSVGGGREIVTTLSSYYRNRWCRELKYTPLFAVPPLPQGPHRVAVGGYVG